MAFKTVYVTDHDSASMYMYNATQLITIAITQQYHGVIGFSAGGLENWTFGAGSANLGGGIATEADATALQVTTDAAHGLSDGDVVVQVGMNNAGHNGATRITVVNATNYTCDDITYVAGAGGSTGVVDEPSYLLAGTGAAGKYLINYSLSGEPAGADTFMWEMNYDTTEINEIVAEREHSNNDIGNKSSGGNVDIADGQRVYLTTKNLTGTNNYTIRQANVNLHKI